MRLLHTPSSVAETYFTSLVYKVSLTQDRGELLCFKLLNILQHLTSSSCGEVLASRRYTWA